MNYPLVMETSIQTRTIWIILSAVLALLLAPFTANAQPPGKVWRIGLCHVGIDHTPPSLDTLREGLKVLGYEEGKNLRLDWRNLPDEKAAHETAREFVRDRVDLIVAFENQCVRAAKAFTNTIPIVFLHADDPVGAGFVQSLSRPGGNLTGFQHGFSDYPGKKLELFKQLVPRLRRVLLLKDPTDPLTAARLAEVRKASASLNVDLVEKAVTDGADIENVFGSRRLGDIDGVFPLSPNIMAKFGVLLIQLATKRGLPLVLQRKEWAARGALFSYGTDLGAVGRAGAIYVAKILEGAKPGDLPVERRTRFKLVINLKTANALGLKIDPSLLFQADELIR